MPTISPKGQVTIPRAVRNELGLKPGDRIEFVKGSSGRYALWAINSDIRSLKGMIKSPLGRAVTVEEMNEAIALGAVGRWERSTT
jgi:AbrB family looped-hinge helix DNA binding protein